MDSQILGEYRTSNKWTKFINLTVEHDMDTNLVLITVYYKEYRPASYEDDHLDSYKAGEDVFDKYEYLCSPENITYNNDITAQRSRFSRFSSVFTKPKQNRIDFRGKSRLFFGKARPPLLSISIDTDKHHSDIVNELTRIGEAITELSKSRKEALETELQTAIGNGHLKNGSTLADLERWKQKSWVDQHTPYSI